MGACILLLAGLSAMVGDVAFGMNSSLVGLVIIYSDRVRDYDS